jgi:hypothetical protein
MRDPSLPDFAPEPPRPVSAPYGPPPVPGLPPARAQSRNSGKGGIAVFLSVVILVLMAGGGFAAYWFLFSPHRYIGTYRLKSQTSGGFTIDMDEAQKQLQSAAAQLGSTSGTPVTEVVTLELKADGTGQLVDTVTGLSGPLASLVAGVSGAPKTVTWHMEGRTMEAELDASALAMNGLTGTSAADSVKLTGKFEKGLLKLSGDQPSPFMGGTQKLTLVFQRQ